MGTPSCSARFNAPGRFLIAWLLAGLVLAGFVSVSAGAASAPPASTVQTAPTVQTVPTALGDKKRLTLQRIKKQTVAVGKRLKVTAKAKDLDRGPRRLRFTTKGKPAWAAMNTKKACSGAAHPRRLPAGSIASLCA